MTIPDRTFPGGMQPSDGDDRLLAYRDQFPILEETNYLISNSLGAVPAAASAACKSITRPGPRGVSGPGKRPGGRWSPTSATSSPR